MEFYIKGCLWGAIVGDALGTRYEFSPSEDARQMVIEDMNGTDFLPMLGKGPFNLAPGQPTDDSELMISLLDALVENNGVYNKETVAKNYLQWFNSPPFDIGRTTRFAFSRATNYNSIYQSSQLNNTSSKSNGCLMRAMPLGIASIYSLNTELAQLDTPLTNPPIDCINAVEIYTTAIQYCIGGFSRKSILKNIYQLANEPNKKIINDSLKTPVSQPADGPLCGYYAIALQNALYHFFAGTTFHNAMVETIKMGGDTDTNCCILGGLLGAYRGIASIPTKWLETVQQCHNPNHNRHERFPIIQPIHIDTTINQMCKIVNHQLKNTITIVKIKSNRAFLRKVGVVQPIFTML